MEWSKLKNIIIIILVLVNIFLLFLFLTRQGSSIRHEAESKEQIIALLEENGISFLPDAVPDDIALPVLALNQTQNGEDTMAAALLGTVEKEDKTGGVSISYRGEHGTADFFNTGKFVFTFSEDAWPLEQQSRRQQAEDCLRKLNLRADWDATHIAEDTTELVYYQLWGNAPVYTCRIVFTYTGDFLTSIDGRYMNGTAEKAADTQPFSTTTALVFFLSGLNDGMVSVCTEVRQMSTGYILQTGRPVSLQPVWRIVTDTGEYYLNTQTRAFTQAE